MKKRIICKELQKGKIICITLIVFITMASALFASATDLLYSLNSSLNTFSKTAKTSHLLQMHSGHLNSDAISHFAENNKSVKDYQIVKMLNIAAEDLYMNRKGSSESGSVIDCSLVVQNSKFDFLLNSKNKIASVKEGQALVPVYYKIKYHLKAGDSIKIKAGSQYKTFKIADFVKDSEMNSSFVSSKRILVNQKDWDKVANKTGTLEYLIEFRMKDIKDTNAVETAYQDKKLPSNGAAITYSEMQLLNGLTDILTAAMLMIVVVFLVIISVLCVRFAMLSSINQDYMDIAVMRGLGIPNKYIESIYQIKYSLLTIAGCTIGYLLSFRLTPLVQQNIELYMGLADKDLINYGIQILAVMMIGASIILLCRKSIKRIEKVNTVNALQDNNEISSDRVIKRPSLFGKGGAWANFKLGIKYLLSYKKPYRILVLIFIALSFLVLLPIQMTSTLKSSQFTSYMGVASSDLRIDFQQGGVNESKASSTLAKYHDIKNYQIFNTYSAKTENAKGESVTVNFERGNYSVFSLSCLTGNLPKHSNEVAVSYLLANDLGIKVGDKVTFTLSGTKYSYKVSGIYQDITNGGKSAKVIKSVPNAKVIRSVININLSSEKKKQTVKENLGSDFRDGKVTDIADYVRQSLGDIISQFNIITLITLLIAILVTILTITVFMRTLIIRYKDDIAVMKALGYKNSDIRSQYRTRIIIPLIVGIIVGSVLVLIAGQPLVSMFAASFGAPKIVLISNPFIVYGLFPLSILMVATIMIYVSSYMLNRISLIQK
ncbi:ABC transporter permease [Streptococcus macacae]|uniref:Efflux ABC transporter, permease protein n=1 Tax=Streptococcus macacae NCTC 11558 TaxID=764298 RepID=G5JX03_9STRE|nr:FtsX-like permease family protein [Streptococcus macacae]EHJ51949.1 efflux ABC transporter, permease protein [Streptococcus macacae NCTC 11558]SUN79479.1 ABC transporter permease [Streptococcus macacae NCTC 11558]